MRAVIFRLRALLVLAASFQVVFAAQHVGASTVVPMTMPALADLAGQVIVGRVAAVRSYWAENPRRIESEIQFERVDFLKGQVADAPGSFTLIVPGGKAGDLQMQIADAPSFFIGEKWVLFLLPTYKTFPIVGLNQGAFRVEADAAGVERVYLPGHEAVHGIAPDGVLESVRTDPRRPQTRQVSAQGVQVRPVQNGATSAQPAISVKDFLQQLSPILAASRDYRLTEPAGRHVPVVHTPTQLRTSAKGNPPAAQSGDSAQLRKPTAPEATHQSRREKDHAKSDEAQP